MRESPGPAVILLIDDDDGLRNVLGIILRRAGHTVLEAGSGTQALVLAARQRVDLIVSDVVMPGLSGPETVALLNCDRPPIPTLYISGYDRRETARYGVPAHGVGFMQKPIVAADLTARVAALLDDAAPAAGDAPRGR